MLEELVGGSAAWPDDYRDVKGWSGGTAILQQFMEEADEAERVRVGFFARLEPRREDWALRVLRSAHVLKGAENVDWTTYAGTVKALLDGQALETIPIIKYVGRRTNRDRANEELQRGQGCADGRHDEEEAIAELAFSGHCAAADGGENPIRPSG